MGKSAEALAADAAGPPPLRGSLVAAGAEATDTTTLTDDTTLTSTEKAFAEVLAGVLKIQHVPVDLHFFDDLGADSMLMAQFCARVRKRSDLPKVSIKDVYQHPTVTGLAGALAGPDVAPAAVLVTSGVEDTLAEVLAGVLKIQHVPVDLHFFDDLGADSMLMAQFCARLRKHADVPKVSMKDVYHHPTIKSLVAALAPADAGPAPASTDEPVAVAAAVDDATPGGVITSSTEATRAHPWEYYLCGTLQLLIFLGYCSATGLVMTRGYDWISDSVRVTDIYLRSVLVGTGIFIGLSVLPIVAKWVLIGRWKPQEIRVWSLAYVRFWLVKTLVRANPLALLFAGTPLYPTYLRALGAKIGPGVAIFSKHVPICADLLTIGADTVIGKESMFLCYRAHDGRIQTGAVTLGQNVFIGEKAVLDINSSMGDGAQLGHTSSLHSGQAVPSGEQWHGSPAIPAGVNYNRIAPARCGRLRRISYSSFVLLRWVLVYLPLAWVIMLVLLTKVPELAPLLDPAKDAPLSLRFYGDALVMSLAVFVIALLGGLLFVGTVPRVLSRFIRPGKVYPLYGFHYGMHRAIERLTNLKFFTYLFGDSSAIVHYLRWIGYDLGRIEQTGSNFGMEVKHESPHLTSIGTGTMVADALFILNADYSSTSFRLSPVSIGANNFLGNHIMYPVGGRTGDNCLLATKVMIPIEGKVYENVGLLGSPCFEIPRSVARDSQFDHLATGDEKRRRLARKNRFDARTMGLYLLARWGLLFTLTTLSMVTADFYGDLAHSAADFTAMSAFGVLGLVAVTTYFVLLERIFTAFRPLQPQYCSLYEPYFWWHERYWKVPLVDLYLRAFDGTPFKLVVLRLLGLRIGRRVFDDGCQVTEKTLTVIGDSCTLNYGSHVQCHSQEDGTFKSGRVTIGADCTVGISAWVHYGTTMGDGSMLAPDSFLMKGEEVPPLATWGGNPAREI